MKKKFVCSVLTCCVLGLALAGCGGKSSEVKPTVSSQQEQPVADNRPETQTDAAGNEQEASSGVEEAPEVYDKDNKRILVEPLPELVNSEWYDRKVQIFDMMFVDDWSMTAEDIKRIAEGSSYDIKFSEGFGNTDYSQCSFTVAISTTTPNGESTGKAIVFNSRSPYDGAGNYAVEFGLVSPEKYYTFDYEHLSYIESLHAQKYWYNLASIEFQEYKTRDDVLGYLSANGYKEVEQNRTPYLVNTQLLCEKKNFIFDKELADTSHYWCDEAQNITLCRIHKLGETDKSVSVKDTRYGTSYYYGAHLNMVNFVTFEFNPDGTIASTSQRTWRCTVCGDKQPEW